MACVHVRAISYTALFRVSLGGVGLWCVGLAQKRHFGFGKFPINNCVLYSPGWTNLKTTIKTEILPLNVVNDQLMTCLFPLNVFRPKFSAAGLPTNLRNVQLASLLALFLLLVGVTIRFSRTTLEFEGNVQTGENSSVETSRLARTETRHDFLVHGDLLRVSLYGRQGRDSVLVPQ